MMHGPQNIKFMKKLEQSGFCGLFVMFIIV